MNRRFLAIGALLLLGCGGSGEQGQDAGGGTATIPTGVVWKWIGVEGADPEQVGRPGRYTLEFLPDGRYALRADCNSGAGGWSVLDGVLQLGEARLTEAFCGPESLDQRFLDLLEGVGRFSVDGDRLVLQAAGPATRMIFERMPALDLAGTSWVVRAINNGREAVVSVRDGSELWLRFGEDGTLTGSTGCNQLTGSFTVAGQTVQVGPVATTRRVCTEEEANAQEADFLGALETVTTWEIRGERAQLRTDAGALAVDLVSAVSGQAWFRGTGAVPVDAVLALRIVDGTGDAGLVLGEASLPVRGRRWPLDFLVPFDPSEVDPSRHYVLEATLLNAGNVLARPAGPVRVLGREGARFGIEIDLEPAGP